MACAPTPTATLYATVTTLIPSTSFSLSSADVQVTTVVQQTCIASGTISGSAIGCVSSAQVTQVNTIGGGQTAQVPIVATIPVTGTQPTRTLFAPCSSGGDSSSPSQTSQTSQQSSINTPLTTSVLVQSTPSPSTVIEASSTTLSDGSVVQTVVTAVTTPPPTSLYVATSLANPTLQSSSSPRSGTNVAPIVGGVLGGFLGLIVVVGSFWWLCRRRRSWDDIFEKEDLQNEEAWTVQARSERRKPKSIAEPKPYQYGLVGRVIPPAAAGESLRMSQYSSVSEHSGTHSRGTSLSATPLLQNTHLGSSRPSTAGSTPAIQIQPVPRMPVDDTRGEPRSLSMASHASSTRPLLDGRPAPASLSTWTPNMDELAVLEPLNHTGSPVASTERRVLQIVNSGPPSPTDTVSPGAHQSPSGPSPGVIIHTDGGRVPDSSFTGEDTNPPPYSR